MGTASFRCAALLHRAVGAALATLFVHAAAAQAGASAPGATPCDVSLSDRFPPGCKDAAAMPAVDESPASDGDAAPARDHDDLADRPKQLETMNQQLRMERRRKDTLLHLYPDEAAHNAARLQALAETDRPIRAAEDRIEGLTHERRRLGEAVAIYAGKPLPAGLHNQLLRVDNALQQAVSTLANCRDERALIGRNYDEELGVLRKLWAAQHRGVGVMARRGS